MRTGNRDAITGVTIATAPREIRASDGRLGVAPPLQTAAAGAFAAAIVRRYAGGAASTPVLDLVLRSLPAGMILQRFERRVDLHVTPHLALSVEQVAHRLAARAERVEFVAAPGRTDSGLPLPIAQPVPRVVQRTVPAAEPALVEGRPSAHQASARLHAADGSPPASAALPPIDMNRLTDQVVQAIDRRIVGLRERLGKG